ncbi:MAG TPA: alpha/beta hydrolase fold domain-containing protein, partial [Terracidiphilus sp.]|nr:alpha/beta hydrolase fold domain-containing protein [Terracidiphilus sp.]
MRKAPDEMRSFMKLAAVGSLLVSLIGVAQEKRTPTEDGVVYGVADGQSLTMDYYAPKGSGLGPGPGQGQGRGPHPIAIVIHGGGYHGGTSKNGSEAYVADFLAPAGYAVFSVNYRLAPQ